jgi:hypothetical protein
MDMIIGFCGKKGSGKDTAAKYLVENYGYTRVGFADNLKKSVAALFNIPIEWVDEFKDDLGHSLPRVEVIVDVCGSEGTSHPDHHQYSFSWREFLQRYGTESHREVFGYDFWVDQVLPYHPMSVAGWDEFVGQNLAISDARFDNEVARIRYYEGKIVEIVRPMIVDQTDQHISEQVPTPDFRLINREDNMVNLYAALDEWMETQVAG